MVCTFETSRDSETVDTTKQREMGKTLESSKSGSVYKLNFDLGCYLSQTLSDVDLACTFLLE